jgi:hypothetical protein
MNIATQHKTERTKEADGQNTVFGQGRDLSLLNRHSVGGKLGGALGRQLGGVNRQRVLGD